MLLPTVTPLGISGAALLFGANLGDVITAIVVLAIIIMSALLQLMGKAKQGQPGRRAGRPGRPVRAGQPRGAAQRGGKPQVEDEIADFLRRAAQRRKPRPAQRAPRPAVAPRPAQRAKEVVAEVVPEPGRPVTVAEHVRRHLDTSEITQETRELGSGISRTEREMEQRVQETFARGLSGEEDSLVQTTPRSVELARPRGPSVPITAAAGLAAFLADANNLRQAIVLNEILTRPEERWT